MIELAGYLILGLGLPALFVAEIIYQRRAEQRRAIEHVVATSLHAQLLRARLTSRYIEAGTALAPLMIDATIAGRRLVEAFRHVGESIAAAEAAYRKMTRARRRERIRRLFGLPR